MNQKEITMKQLIKNLKRNNNKTVNKEKKIEKRFR